MRHTRQRFNSDCGVAVASTATNTSYLTVNNTNHVKHRPKGMFSEDLRILLENLSNQNWILWIINNPIPIDKYVPPKNQITILRITKNNRAKSHFTCTDGNYYYDPEEKRPIPLRLARTLPSYKGWYVEEEFFIGE